MVKAIDELWMYTGELFSPADYELQTVSSGKGTDLNVIKSNWTERVTEIFNEATLTYPRKIFMQTGGKEGKHTEHLGYILADLQFMQRAYPNSEW
jgi:ring-1,2-phenylacetyl-CoA epoxidase subunit PaaC